MANINLKVLGISQSNAQTGAFALVLATEDDRKRIPIIIGGFEAQAIAITLEGLKPHRPLSHDLFINFISAFNIEINKIFIYKLEEGVFHSEIHTTQNDTKIVHDARTSDAIALAIRVEAPIYITEEILEEAGIESQSEELSDDTTVEETVIDSNKSIYDSTPLTELNDLLQTSISNEDYETASKIRDEINSRQ